MAPSSTIHSGGITAQVFPITDHISALSGAPNMAPSPPMVQRWQPNSLCCRPLLSPCRLPCYMMPLSLSSPPTLTLPPPPPSVLSPPPSLLMWCCLCVFPLPQRHLRMSPLWSQGTPPPLLWRLAPPSVGPLSPISIAALVHASVSVPVSLLISVLALDSPTPISTPLYP